MAIDKITTPAVTDDSVTLAKMAPGTDGNIISYDASGNPVAVATGSSGQVLTSAGAGAPPTFATAATGGITGADSWRLTTSFSGNADPISSNLERVDTDSYGVIGSAMTVSSGIFTFPTTGIWLIEATFFTRCNGANRAHAGGFSTTTNNSSYSDTAGNYSSMYNSGNDTYSNSKCSFIFDVTSTSTHKVKFYISTDNQSSVTAGNTDSNNTAFTFIRLGEIHKMDINGRPNHIEDYLVQLHTGQWFGWSDAKNKVYANLIILDDTKSKPSESDCTSGLATLQSDFDTAQTNAETKKASGKQKLKDLGLDDDEIQALIGV